MKIQFWKKKYNWEKVLEAHYDRPYFMAARIWESNPFGRNPAVLWERVWRDP